MIALGIETATLEVGVALAGDEGVIAERRVRIGRRHVELLHVQIEAVLAEASISLRAIDAIVVDVGPGRFTGLRVGVAAAKALAFALDLRLVSLTSTAVLAHAAGRPGIRVVPVIDVRRSELAWPSLVTSSLVLGPPEQLREELAGLADELLLVGDGALAHRSLLAGPGRSFGGHELAAPPVTALALLGRDAAAAGRVVDPAALVPCYLRPPDAKVNWTTRQNGESGLAVTR